MIRDPSDGSVTEKPKVEMTSGLSISKENAQEIARLERSREWLKQYRKAVDDLNRMNDRGIVTRPDQPKPGQ